LEKGASSPALFSHSPAWSSLSPIPQMRSLLGNEEGSPTHLGMTESMSPPAVASPINIQHSPDEPSLLMGVPYLESIGFSELIHAGCFEKHISENARLRQEIADLACQLISILGPQTD